jgi:hypothetical protein
MMTPEQLQQQLEQYRAASQDLQLEPLVTKEKLKRLGVEYQTKLIDLQIGYADPLGQVDFDLLKLIYEQFKLQDAEQPTVSRFVARTVCAGISQRDPVV